VIISSSGGARTVTVHTQGNRKWCNTSYRVNTSVPHIVVSPTPSLPVPAEKSTPPISHSHHVLQRNHRERADQLHLHLGCWLQSLRLEGSSESGENNWEYYWDFSAPGPGHSTKTLWPGQWGYPQILLTHKMDCSGCLPPAGENLILQDSIILILFYSNSNCPWAKLNILLFYVHCTWMAEWQIKSQSQR